MSVERVLVLALVGFVAAAISAMSGGNSLFTVPVMLLAGMDPKTAVATNMLGVTALSAGAAARFLREDVIPHRPTVGLIAGSLPGSVAGALVALAISDAALRAIISVAMLAMAVFIALSPRLG